MGHYDKFEGGVTIGTFKHKECCPYNNANLFQVGGSCECWYPIEIDKIGVETSIDPLPIRPKEADKVDLVNHPPHYTAHPSGIECIQVTEHMDFLIGNAIKYLWRAGIKDAVGVEDLKKAVWYIERKIKLIGEQ